MRSLYIPVYTGNNWANIFLSPQLKITAINGVSLDSDKYDTNLGKWPFFPAAKLSRAEVKDKPLAAPNVEQATPSGTIHAKSLNTFAPNVVATALG